MTVLVKVYKEELTRLDNRLKYIDSVLNKINPDAELEIIDYSRQKEFHKELNL